MSRTNDYGRNTTWSYLIEFLSQNRSPWDQGLLEAHWDTAAPTPFIQANLERAKQKRRSFLAILSSWRRNYLNGLIWGYEKELERRVHLDET
ncbi:hypothetical protein SAMN05444166_2947 [Singulisphaera sp. GP187]|uniref:hypothetical protein n=1 Tax=Singulisphaera sp. GP187 TaxID=1882752 RepID=UPI0009267E4D|nr:hypothetical protein [Singulisphaera sp. GP187]SIO19856.1 hypothetical protein SAMN05444166_2947 [Singulisphaera sp. GP187]